MEDIIAKLVDLEEEINADIDCLVNTKREIMTSIQTVSRIDHRTLLELRYICCKTWEYIAEQLSVSTRSVHRIHGEALCEIAATAKNIIEK